MDTLCLDVKRLASVYCGTGAIRTESSRWRYHRLPVVWCFNFSLKDGEIHSAGFPSLNSPSPWSGAAALSERTTRAKRSVPMYAESAVPPIEIGGISNT